MINSFVRVIANHHAVFIHRRIIRQSRSRLKMLIVTFFAIRTLYIFTNSNFTTHFLFNLFDSNYRSKWVVKDVVSVLYNYDAAA